jgi:hypothetical protein
VHDALGRVVGAARVAAGAGEAALPVGGLAPGLYLAEFVPDRADRPRAAARLELR